MGPSSVVAGGAGLVEVLVALGSGLALALALEEVRSLICMRAIAEMLEKRAASLGHQR